MLAVFHIDPEWVRQAFSWDVFSGRAPLYLTHGKVANCDQIFLFFSSGSF